MLSSKRIACSVGRQNKNNFVFRNLACLWCPSFFFSLFSPIEFCLLASRPNRIRCTQKDADRETYTCRNETKGRTKIKRASPCCLSTCLLSLPLCMCVPFALCLSLYLPTCSTCTLLCTLHCPCTCLGCSCSHVSDGDGPQSNQQ